MVLQKLIKWWWNVASSWHEIYCDRVGVGVHRRFWAQHRLKYCNRIFVFSLSARFKNWLQLIWRHSIGRIGTAVSKLSMVVAQLNTGAPVVPELSFSSNKRVGFLGKDQSEAEKRWNLDALVHRHLVTTSNTNQWFRHWNSWS